MIVLLVPVYVGLFVWTAICRWCIFRRQMAAMCSGFERIYIFEGASK